MAGFRMHVGTSSVLGVGYAATLHTMYGVPMPTAAVAGALCGVAGMLPDLDSDYGLPLREAMSFAAATIPVLLVNRFESLQLSRDAIVIISIGLYLFVRFGVANMIRKFTVHRGMFHSIPAMLTFGGITYLLTGGSPTNDRYMMAGGVMGGFMSHLILDEIYAVEFKGGRWRTKKSFGTAHETLGRRRQVQLRRIRQAGDRRHGRRRRTKHVQAIHCEPAAADKPTQRSNQHRQQPWQK